jgi:hypothetical protein
MKSNPISALIEQSIQRGREKRASAVFQPPTPSPMTKVSRSEMAHKVASAFTELARNPRMLRKLAEEDPYTGTGDPAVQPPTDADRSTTETQRIETVQNAPEMNQTGTETVPGTDAGRDTTTDSTALINAVLESPAGTASPTPEGVDAAAAAVNNAARDSAGTLTETEKMGQRKTAAPLAAKPGNTGATKATPMVGTRAMPAGGGGKPGMGMGGKPGMVGKAGMGGPIAATPTIAGTGNKTAPATPPAGGHRRHSGGQTQTQTNPLISAGQGAGRIAGNIANTVGRFVGASAKQAGAENENTTVNPEESAAGENPMPAPDAMSFLADAKAAANFTKRQAVQVSNVGTLQGLFERTPYQDPVLQQQFDNAESAGVKTRG